jgi:hypothetical protein
MRCNVLCCMTNLLMCSAPDLDLRGPSPIGYFVWFDAPFGSCVTRAVLWSEALQGVSWRIVPSWLPFEKERP